MNPNAPLPLHPVHPLLLRETPLNPAVKDRSGAVRPRPRALVLVTEESGNVPAVTPGPDLGARDYRANPSDGQSEAEGLASISREDPNVLGTAVAPVPDRTIHSYDLPDEPATYDRSRE